MAVNNASLLAVLLSWAAQLSGYPYPHTVPSLQYRSHEFFVKQACGGSEPCRVAAWYDDKKIIYLDDRITNLRDPMVRSLLVHEMVHYLQDLSGKYKSADCHTRVLREQQAYAAQRLYLNQVAGVFASLWPVYPSCSNMPGPAKTGVAPAVHEH